MSTAFYDTLIAAKTEIENIITFYIHSVNWLATTAVCQVDNRCAKDLIGNVMTLYISL